ncbi:MAG: putative peptidoglycan glycosyltransferase FtsW [Planctomycetia bacterium]|nr:putative peptidoglycan glycosyltransferase FtsW [Planctomycetia bacterium]
MMAGRHNKINWPTRIAWAKPRSRAISGSLPDAGAAPKRCFSVALSPISLTLDQLMLIATMALLGFGLLMTQSANARIGRFIHDWPLRLVMNVEAIHAVLAIALLAFLWRLDYRRLLGNSLIRSVPTVLMAASMVFLALVLTRLGTDINGAKRWLLLRIGSHALSFEPSELAKWSLVLFISSYAVHRGEQIRSFWKGFVPLMMVVGATSALILKEDFGTAALVAGIAALLMLMAGCRWWHLAILVPPVLVVLYFAVWHVPYRRERLLIFMHPHMDPKGAGYNPIQSLLSFASGGFWGRGLGNGIQKMGYLPEDNTDFIFSLIAEELGFFGCIVVILLYLTLVFSGWQVMHRSQDMFGKLLAFGCTAVIALQAAMNIAVVTVTVPTKGIALPLISSGGTGWILTAGAIGLVMSVERINRLKYAENNARPPSIAGTSLPMRLETHNSASRSSV